MLTKTKEKLNLIAQLSQMRVVLTAVQTRNGTKYTKPTGQLANKLYNSFQFYAKICVLLTFITKN